MTTGAFTDFLIAEIEATSDTSFVEAMLRSAREKMLAGGGELMPLTQGTLNGRSVVRTLRMDAADVAAACRAALDYTAEDQKGVSSSRLDFRHL